MLATQLLHKYPAGSYFLSIRVSQHKQVNASTLLAKINFHFFVGSFNVVVLQLYPGTFRIINGYVIRCDFSGFVVIPDKKMTVIRVWVNKCLTCGGVGNNN